jgi:TM2 domain-containing membrane protein YozV
MIEANQTEKINDVCLILVCWFFLGLCGVHRFVAGKKRSGVLMLITSVICHVLAAFVSVYIIIPVYVWWIIDLILIVQGHFLYKTVDKEDN